MENPVREIRTVIELLTQSPPTLQASTIEKFFTPNASFSHPFCRTWSFNGSRWLILAIYRFYKILSPRVDLEVMSIAFDQDNLKLYLTISQIFSIFIIPFYLAPVTLTTVLTLTTDPNEYRGYKDFEKTGRQLQQHDDQPSEDTKFNDETTKYWISSQEDLYQTTEFVKFFLPFGIGVFAVFVWHVFATAGCVFGFLILSPVTWAEERFSLKKEVREALGHNVSEVTGNVVEHFTHEAEGLITGVAESVQERLKEA
ncbi:hypothetical protein TMatcc_005043 [Talaromyces marneffei ATCC 18224]|uniref:SigF-like NTF2-like domain-containing protein n=1 Tax=Talaromyces marneffei (strain ATCC 18224 / CBS 334.59 / QM 7333) TaxID=441960 RepID=B6Q7D5_TALMQ|nr:uncharacterized protein EYB26_000051 [Talaromyces marneffei]EEA26677.1 conserved hypothetical protein [Talaromyces marneffei ATCC 18224]KAE8557579.1 hypothetical protein EYB25_002286 [Talaromyces marneffei]QGA12407.1 hypothetical protein EYB26_000051 [Talaromyces marneffei]